MYIFNVKTSTFWYLWLDSPINDKEGSLQVMIRNLHTKLQHTNDISQFHLVLRLFKKSEAKAAIVENIYDYHFNSFLYILQMQMCLLKSEGLNLD